MQEYYDAFILISLFDIKIHDSIKWTRNDQNTPTQNNRNLRAY